MPNNRDPKMDVSNGVRLFIFTITKFVLTENNNNIKKLTRNG